MAVGDNDTTVTVEEVVPRRRRPTFVPGTRVGRYEIRDLIAEGGMGAVYVAFDPELGRKIALKFVRVRGRSSAAERDARERLLREAQAIAQLSHPNVVAVHDVGTIDSDVFIAMELVEGSTLRDWLKESHDLRDTLSLMIAAGHGLAAAHAAGLVHRDFKPSNVLVGKDGRVRILDFGLARATRGGGQETTASDIDGDDSDSSPTGRLSEQLTRHGMILGTPAYMSPEQFAGGVVDAKSDQYSFAVALYEAAYGERPFRADAARDLEAMVREGRLSPPTKGTAHVPSWLRRVIARGMATHSEERYPTMNELLADLSRDHARGWRRAAFAAAAVAVLGGAAAIAWNVAHDRPPPCTTARAELGNVWSAVARLRLQAAFIASRRPNAPAMFERVAQLLDEHGDAWVHMRTATCEATRVRGEQSEAMLDLRMRCLDRRLTEIRTLTDVLATSHESAIVDRSVDMVLGLDRLDACADPEYVTAAIPPPTDAARAREIAEIRERLDRSNVVLNGGDYKSALDIATRAAADADRTRYAPVIAEAGLRVGWSQVRTGDAKAGLERLDRAAAVAASSKADSILAEVSLSAFYVRGVLLAQYSEALAQKDLVLSIVARAGDAAVDRADALATYGYLLIQTHSPEAAIAVLESARDLFIQGYSPNHPRVAHALNYLAIAQNEIGHFEQGRAALEQALAIWEHNVGPDHPMLISGLINLGSTLGELRRYSEAKAHASRALAIAERLLGKDHPKTALALAALGDIEAKLGACEQALPGLERAIAILEVRSGPNHPSVAYPLITMASCLVDLGRPAGAVAPLERALKIRTEAKAAPAELATPTFELGRALWDDTKQRRHAVELAQQARKFLDGVETRKNNREQIDAWLAAHPL